MVVQVENDQGSTPPKRKSIYEERSEKRKDKLNRLLIPIVAPESKNNLAC